MAQRLAAISNFQQAQRRGLAESFQPITRAVERNIRRRQDLEDQRSSGEERLRLTERELAARGEQARLSRLQQAKLTREEIAARGEQAEAELKQRADIAQKTLDAQTQAAKDRLTFEDEIGLRRLGLTVKSTAEEVQAVYDRNLSRLTAAQDALESETLKLSPEDFVAYKKRVINEINARLPKSEQITNTEDYVTEQDVNLLAQRVLSPEAAQALITTASEGLVPEGQETRKSAAISELAAAHKILSTLAGGRLAGKVNTRGFTDFLTPTPTPKDPKDPKDKDDFGTKTGTGATSGTTAGGSVRPVVEPASTPTGRLQQNIASVRETESSPFATIESTQSGLAFDLPDRPESSEILGMFDAERFFTSDLGERRLLEERAAEASTFLEQGAESSRQLGSFLADRIEEARQIGGDEVTVPAIAETLTRVGSSRPGISLRSIAEAVNELQRRGISLSAGEREELLGRANRLAGVNLQAPNILGLRDPQPLSNLIADLPENIGERTGRDLSLSLLDPTTLESLATLREAPSVAPVATPRARDPRFQTDAERFRLLEEGYTPEANPEMFQTQAERLALYNQIQNRGTYLPQAVNPLTGTVPVAGGSILPIPEYISPTSVAPTADQQLRQEALRNERAASGNSIITL